MPCVSDRCCLRVPCTPPGMVPCTPPGMVPCAPPAQPPKIVPGTPPAQPPTMVPGTPPEAPQTDLVPSPRRPHTRDEDVTAYVAPCPSDEDVSADDVPRTSAGEVTQNRNEDDDKKDSVPAFPLKLLLRPAFVTRVESPIGSPAEPQPPDAKRKVPHSFVTSLCWT